MYVDGTWTPVAGSSNESTSASSIDDTDLDRLRANDVAIVGMACRTAGGVTSPEKLWQLLMDKTDASGEVPSHRWEPWVKRDPRNAAEIDKTIKRGYFIDDLEHFDAAFFGISPKEAEQMDPHQRLALELTWEALESAGIDPKGLAGSDTAVYVGVDSDDYSRLIMEDIPNIEAWMGIGSAPHGVPNRISYHLDLMGPSVAVDAACATSLVALHAGRQAIANGESNVAIVGGVNVMLGPALTRMLGKAGALSPEGVCRSFDDAANGYVRGEGGAIIVLKKLSSAVDDGDHILATLKGSAIAQDGKTNGIMAPNAKAQEMVGRNALARAEVDPLTVSYIEAHATSTSLGDPTEMSAIAALYGSGVGRTADAPALVGSIKPNVGHLEPAAGGIGLIKAVLAMNKGIIPPQANLDKLNTRIPWDTNSLQVVREATKWPEVQGLRRAAVCSYGYGGTVSHAVIEEYRREASFTSGDSEPVVLTLSSLQEKRLPALASGLGEWLATEGASTSLSIVANTLSQRRAHHDNRVAIVASTHQGAIDGLKRVVEGAHDIAKGRVLLGSVADKSRQAVWVYSGHGAQWTDMGKELVRNPVFREAVIPLEGVVRADGGFSPLEALEKGDIDSTERVQILTFIVQVGLTHVLRSQGLMPGAIIGHSVGEIAASVAAGCLSAEEGAMIVTRRARLYTQVRDKMAGAMALVNMSFAQVALELGERLDVVPAIVASPTTCVVSGEAGAVGEYTRKLSERGIKTFKVKTDVGFHSPMLREISDPLKNVLEGALGPRQPTVPLYSTSHPNTRTAALRDADYWVRNMVSPVRLTAAVESAADDGHRVFLEVSSHPVVLHSVNETLLEHGLGEGEFAAVSTMKRGASPIQTIGEAVAQLYVKGVTVDWKLRGPRVWCDTVPRTPWVHKFYYRQVETAEWGIQPTHNVNKHTLLGEKTTVAGTDLVLFTTRLDDKNKPFPGTHPLDGTEIIPAAVYINTFFHATGGCGRTLEGIRLKVPVAMGSDTRHVQVLVRGGEIALASKGEGEEAWVGHSSCGWASTLKEVSPLGIAEIKMRIGTKLPNSFSVDYLAKIGVSGIAFPWQVVEHYGNAKEMLAKVDNDPSVEDTTWDTHSWAPMLDAATSIGSTIFYNDPRLRIVSQIDRVELISRDSLPKVGYIYVQEAADSKSLASHVAVLAEDGRVLARFTSMRFSDVEGAAGVSGSVDSLVHRIDWVPPKFAERPRPMERVVLVARHDVSVFAQQIGRGGVVTTVSGADELEGREDVVESLQAKGSVVVYVPRPVDLEGVVAAATEEFVWETTRLVKLLASRNLFGLARLVVVTDRVFAGETPTALAHGALYGLARIIASEQPDLWGGLIDNENSFVFPMLAAKYVPDQDIIRVVDGLPRRAVMRPLLREQRWPQDSHKTLLPKPEGTYIVTGGFGDCGLETLSFLVAKGARRIVVVSRNGLPPRRKWGGVTDSKTLAAIERVRALEKAGASIHPLALDIARDDAAEVLLDALDMLSLPPVLGVVHAAGIVEDALVLDTTAESYNRVLAPKVRGALALHAAFPPASIDFFVMYSSIGQLVGTAGQASYASANAFLDALATLRRASGDNAVAFQFSAWRGMGLAAGAGFLAAELDAKGVSDISPEDAFNAWEHVGRHDVEGAVVTRARAVYEGEAVALGLLDDVAPRKPRPSQQSQVQEKSTEGTPPPGPERDAYLLRKIQKCIAQVLMIPDPEDVDVHSPLADMGVDSVMTVALRRSLQDALGVRTPPTLVWSQPTVGHLVRWFGERLG